VDIEKIWTFSQNNIEFLKDIEIWFKTINNIIDLKDYDIPEILINTAIENIPDEPFTYDSWDNWVKSISVKTGLKGKNLYMPLRLILTGKDKGPELKNFLPLLDRQTILSKFGKL
jgi:glutamyl-tRNA synthetase